METITAAFVLSVMAHIPPTELSPSEYRWDKLPAASDIAGGIADAVNADEDPLFIDRKSTAILMAVYAAFEGGMQRCAIGDNGKSRGVFQLSAERFSIATACVPQFAAKAWLSLAHGVYCTALSSEEGLAALASGNCDHGRRLVRRRALLAIRLAAEVDSES